MGEIIDLNTRRRQKLAQTQDNIKPSTSETVAYVLFLGTFADTESYKAIKAASGQLLRDHTYQDALAQAKKLSIKEVMGQLNEVSPDYIKSHPTWYVALWDRLKNHYESSLNL